MNTNVVEEYRHKAEKVVSEIQAEELVQVMRILKEDVFINCQRKYYILIDDLDKDWIDQEMS